MFELSNNRMLECVFERISAIIRYDMDVGCGLVIPLSRSLVRKVRGCDIDYILARLSTFASTANVESRANHTTFTPPLGPSMPRTQPRRDPPLVIKTRQTRGKPLEERYGSFDS